MTYAHDFSEDDGEGRLDAAIEDGTDAADQHVRPLGSVESEDATKGHARCVLLQKHITVSTDVRAKEDKQKYCVQNVQILI